MNDEPEAKTAYREIITQSEYLPTTPNLMLIIGVSNVLIGIRWYQNMPYEFLPRLPSVAVAVLVGIANLVGSVFVRREQQ